MNYNDPDERQAEAERLAIEEDEWQAEQVRHQDSYEEWLAWHEEHAPERIHHPEEPKED